MTGSPSSTTAQGYLPNYSGSAVSSMSNTDAYTKAVDYDTIFEVTDNIKRPDSFAARTENRPPLIHKVSASSSTTPMSAADLLRKTIKKERKEHRDAGFNENTAGVGPTFGSDW
jgi:hypothetical protein